MSNKNRNYTNYSKPNKPAENVQNTQNTKTEVDDTLIPVGSLGNTNMINPESQQETEPTSNTAPEPQPEPEAPKAVTGVVVNCEKLNIRETPFKTAEVLCIINKGEKVEVFEELSTDDFYAVTFGKDKEVSIEGYCMKQYIEINK